MAVGCSAAATIGPLGWIAIAPPPRSPPLGPLCSSPPLQLADNQLLGTLNPAVMHGCLQGLLAATGSAAPAPLRCSCLEARRARQTRRWRPLTSAVAAALARPMAASPSSPYAGPASAHSACVCTPAADGMCMRPCIGRRLRVAPTDSLPHGLGRCACAWRECGGWQCWRMDCCTMWRTSPFKHAKGTCAAVLPAESDGWGGQRHP